MKLVFSILLLVVVMLVFQAAGGYGIINLDDVIYLKFRAGQYGLNWAFTWVGDGMWVPLTWISYWADRSVFGENWGLYHWHNIVLHSLSTAALFLFLAEVFTAKSKRALIVVALGTLVWAIHPLRVESVVWLASRKDCVSALFFIWALLTWVRAKNRVGYFLSLALVCVATLGKSSVMVFPAFVIAIDYLILARPSPAWAYLTASLLAIGLAVEAAWAQNKGGACFVGTIIPFWYKLLNAMAAHTVYAFNHVVPTRLAVQCQLRYPALPRYSMFGLVLLGLCLYRIYIWWKLCLIKKVVVADAVSAGLLIYFVSFIPFLGLFGFGGHSLADRFTLLPDLGLTIALVSFTISMLNKPLSRPLWLTVEICAVGALALITRQQIRLWADEKSLFGHTIEVDGKCNLLACDELIQQYYEADHDFEKIFKTGLLLFNGPGWQQRAASHLGPILMEAAYETGHVKEAEDFYFWQLHWGREIVKDLKQDDPSIGQTETMEFSEIVRLAYTDGMLNEARSRLKRFEKNRSENFLYKNLRCILARRGGDRQELKEAISSAYAPSEEEALHNVWALRLINTKDAERLND